MVTYWPFSSSDKNKSFESYECQCIAKIGLSCKFFWKYILCPSTPTSVKMLLHELKMTTLAIFDRMKRKEMISTRGKLTSYLTFLKEVCSMCFPNFVCNSMAKDILFIGAGLCLLKVLLSNNGFHILKDYIFFNFPIPFNPMFSFLFCI
jgi:hypothetical protein